MSSKINFDSGWGLEECLDVQMVHTMAPYANIMVVEAASASISALNSAIIYAVNNGANIINMSYGTPEFITQNIYNTVYTNKQVCYLASAGDTTATVEIPSAYPNVMSVGGTSLYLDGSGNRTTPETTWSNGGCGVSKYVNRPTYQNVLSVTKRNCCDISLDANPATGVIVYYSNKLYNNIFKN